jgi:hypothetical protein
MNGPLPATVVLAPGTHCIGGWMGRKVDLDSVVKTKERSCLSPVTKPGRSARIPYLYQLSYPGFSSDVHKNIDSPVERGQRNLVPGRFLIICPLLFTLEDRAAGTHWIGDWVGPRAGLNTAEYRIISQPCRLTRSPSQYRLSCPGF